MSETFCFWYNAGEDKDMTITQLIYFDSVAQTLNIARTAETFHVTPPAVSKAIRDLEKEYETALFIRDGNKLLLTQAGSLFQEKIMRFLKQYRQLEADLHTADTAVQKPFVLGVSGHFVQCSYPVLHKYLEKNDSGMNISLVEEGIEAIDRLRLGLIDGILWAINDADPAYEYQFKGNTKSVQLGSLPFRFYVRRDLFRHDTPEIKASDLKGVPIVFSKPNAKTNYLEQILIDAIGTPNFPFVTHQLHIGIVAVRNGTAGMFLPEFDYGFGPDIGVYTLQEFQKTNVYFLYQNEHPDTFRIVDALRKFYSPKKPDNKAKK